MVEAYNGGERRQILSHIFETATPLGSSAFGATSSASRPVEIAFKVLESVAELQPVGVGELSRRLELPKSTVQRALRSLEALRYVHATGEVTKWSLTLRSVFLGSRASLLDLREAALEDLRRLSAATEETLNVAVPEGRDMVVIDKLDSSRPVRAHSELGDYLPMHASALGKSYLAALDDATLHDYLAAPLARLTDKTITDPRKFEKELQRVRLQGYATSEGEKRPETHAVAAAILNATGTPVAAISIVAPVSRLSGCVFQEVGTLIAECAARISARLGWQSAVLAEPKR